eukprot:SAG11_NODE_6324_length_1336_cov_1.606306_1_plen_52_part_10
MLCTSKMTASDSPLYHDKPSAGEAGGFDCCVECAKAYLATLASPSSADAAAS